MCVCVFVLRDRHIFALKQIRTMSVRAPFSGGRRGANSKMTPLCLLPSGGETLAAIRLFESSQTDGYDRVTPQHESSDVAFRRAQVWAPNSPARAPSSTPKPIQTPTTQNTTNPSPPASRLTCSSAHSRADTKMQAGYGRGPFQPPPSPPHTTLPRRIPSPQKTTPSIGGVPLR